MKIESTYYDRKMCSEIVEHINSKLSWLIQYVKERPSLDFQTGHDPKGNRSWFSIYRGTGRVFTIKAIKGKIKPYFAAGAYEKLMRDLFKDPSPELFDKYLSIIESEPKFDCYYKDSKGILKEGYFQGLIGRRYTFNLTDDDDFVIIDKEFVIGFKNDETKKDWNGDIISEQEDKIETFRKDYKGKLPKDIKASYGEFDFLALNKDGDILIMELKQNDPPKTSLSPIQTNYYYMQFEKLMREDSLLSNKINDMIAQKIELGIISECFKKNLPIQLSGKIIPCVIVGEDSKLSDTICDRYKFCRNIFLPTIKAYTCKDDGTLVDSKKLK